MTIFDVVSDVEYDEKKNLKKVKFKVAEALLKIRDLAYPSLGSLLTNFGIEGHSGSILVPRVLLGPFRVWGHFRSIFGLRVTLSLFWVWGLL